MQTPRRIWGITFSNPKLLEAALTHPSYRNEHPHLRLSDFDRMEFFGDAILNYVICCELIEAFPNANEGLHTRYRSTLVSRKILTRIAQEIKLKKWLKVGQSLQKNKIVQLSKILSDALESVIAAVYQDQGLQAAREFIIKHFGPYLNPRRLVRLDPNPKSTLQELTQKQWKRTPVYSWKPTRQGIRVEVRIGRKYQLALTGKNRRDLEQKVARELLKKLELEAEN